MPHFEWLVLARAGWPTSRAWVRVLVGVVVGFVIVAIVLLVR